MSSATNSDAFVVEHAGSMIGLDRGERRDDRDSARMPPSIAARFTSGAAADALRAAGARARAPDLLLERLEEAGREHEHDDPEPVERVVVVGRVAGRQLAVRQDQERVRGEADDAMPAPMA